MSGPRRRQVAIERLFRPYRPSFEALEAREVPAGLPILHSRPDAPAVLFLDFDGQTVGSTTYQPYDTNGDPANFNAAEQAAIIECWRHISVYFAMFDVDVATEMDSRPVAWHLSSNSISGGYSYVGVFPNNQPLSFNQSGDVTGRQSGIAHEFGHNLGNSHQSDYDGWGTKTAEYSSGWDNLHGPIMGVDFAQRVHKWFLGHPSYSASALQDDLAVIAANFIPFQAAGGDGYAPDDFAGTFGGATTLPTVNGLQTVRGIIERMNDLDTFRFTHSGGTAVIDLYPDDPSSLDAKVEIYDSAFNLVGAADRLNFNDQQITIDLAAGDYYIQVSSHGDYGDLGVYQLTARKLANQWSHGDIGTVGIGGTAGLNPTTGETTVAGSGADIWGTADAFHYQYLRLNGDGRIVTQVTQNQNTNAWAKAGVMIRETLAANSRHVSLFTTASNGPQMAWRTATGGSSGSFNPNTGQAFTPRWIALERTGDIFTSYLSADGVTWTQFQQQTATMGTTVYIGLAVGAVNNNRLNTALFKAPKLYGAVLPGTPAPAYNGLSAPTGLTPTVGVGTNVNLAWNAVSGATGYAIDRSADGGTWSQLGTATGTTFVDNNPFGSMRWWYRVRATDGTGSGVPSGKVSIVNKPAAATNFTISSWTTSQLILNWRDQSGDTGYRIERSTDGVNYTTVQTVGTNVPSWTDSGLAINTQYWYRLASLSPQGDSLYSTAVSRYTRLASVAGLQFTSITDTAMAFQWNAVAGATSYRIERSLDGSSWSTLTTVAGTSHTDTGLTALEDYYYRVYGVNTTNNTQSQNPGYLFGATSAASPLPSPWLQQDIGAVGGPGAAGESAGTFTILASGADIWNNSDEFRFVHRTLAGDGTITARVVSLTNTSDWAKAGVMMRESLNANSKHAMTIVSRANGTAFQRRTTTGGASSHTGGSGSAPYWVRMTRVGNLFTSQVSSNGTSWTTLGSATITMGGTIFVGLCVSATNDSLMNRAVFDNVAFSGASGSFGGGKGDGGRGSFFSVLTPQGGRGQVQRPDSPMLAAAASGAVGGANSSLRRRAQEALAAGPARRRQAPAATMVADAPTTAPYANGLPTPGHHGCTCGVCCRYADLLLGEGGISLA